MSATVNFRVNVPVTDEQVNAFKTWVREKYANSAAFQAALGAANNNEINEYIITNILPSEIKAILVEAAPFVGSRSTDARVKELQHKRRKIIDKVRYLKDKLARLVFSEAENRQMYDVTMQERANRHADARRRFREVLRVTQPTFVMAEERARHDRTIRSYVMRILEEADFLTRVYVLYELDSRVDLEYLQSIAIAIVRTPIWHKLIRLLSERRSVEFKKTAISEELASTHMKEDCCICFDNHELNAVVEGPCGHQFGKYCFQEWSKKCTNANVACPLCRGNCNQVAEFVVSN
jgi:hypothetical protein